MMNKEYIAIEGAIGVGKTTLAKNISNTMKCQTLFEEYADNPFLQKLISNIKLFICVHIN